MNRWIAVSALAAATAGMAIADGLIVIDGTADAKYGTPIVVQDTLTGFGDSNLGETGWASGSELDSAYAFLDLKGGYLYLLLAGNLESNFNKLEVFIDAGIGGQNQLRGDNPDVDFNGLNRMGFLDKTQPGFKFDEGFNASFWFSATCGNPDELGIFALYANAAQILPEGGGQGAYLGTCGDGETIFSALGIEVSINNSNTRGVTGSNGGTGSGAGVTTGLEAKIPLALLGYVEGPIKVCTFINGGGHDYVSNQFLGGTGGTQNLSCGPDACNYIDPRVVDLTVVAGDQYFVVGGDTPPPPCPADLSGDGVVGGADIAIVLGSWGPCVGCPADLNGDGVVGGADIAIVLGAWGPCPL